MVPPVACSTRGRICRAFSSLRSLSASALPERDSERLPGFAVAENHVSDVTSLVPNAWMNDVSNNRGNIGDALGCRLQEIHSRKHFLTSHQTLVAIRWANSRSGAALLVQSGYSRSPAASRAS